MAKPLALDFSCFDEENTMASPPASKAVVEAPRAELEAEAQQPEEQGEDADAAFARLVAEQERAFFLMRGGNANEMGDDQGADAGEHAAGGEAGEEAEDDDMAFARALQEEEARDWQQRMHALAGLPPPGEAAEAGADGGELMLEDEEFEDDPVDVDAMTYEELLALGEAAGHVSRGVSAATVAALPQSAYSAAAHAAGAGAEQCAVCRAEFEVGDALATLPCAHFYHAACLAPWLTLNKACPCCKRDVAGITPARPAAAARA